MFCFPICSNPSRRGGGGREEGWGPLGRPASCSQAASPLPPMGDASVPTPLRPSPAPTNVTICPKIPTVERGCHPLTGFQGCALASPHRPAQRATFPMKCDRTLPTRVLQHLIWTHQV